MSTVCPTFGCLVCAQQPATNQSRASSLVIILASCAAAVLLVAAPQTCEATPGPDSVAVIANLGHPGAKALLEDYGTRRHIPQSQRCTVDVKPFIDISAGDFRNKVALPILQCLLTGKSLDRIESMVLLRGMPRRVDVQFDGGTLKVALAAVLSVYRTTIGKAEASILSKAPGFKGLCSDGVPCWAATWKNPYSSGAFGADWQRTTGPIAWKLWLVTAIDGYTDADATKLIDAAIASETPDLKAEWLLMKGADSARAALDSEYPNVAEQLSGYVPGPVKTEKFDSDLVGRHLMAFVTGTAKIGKTIEGNTFAAGALVDNLTSLGAVPTNFNAPEIGGQQAQVSVSRWVRAGATGVHGTVAEPLSNCFPSRNFLVDYASGATLAEAYWKNLPFVYWMNLIIGDPMVAPFAVRPTVSIKSADGQTDIQGHDLLMPASGSVKLTFFADTGDDEIGYLRVFVDGAMAASVTDASVTIEVPVGERHIVAVAQLAKSDKGGGVWQSKGWGGWTGSAFIKRGAGEGKPDVIDGADSGEDTDTTPVGPNPEDSGCRASSGPNAAGDGQHFPWALALLTLLVLRMRRTDSRPANDRRA